MSLGKKLVEGRGVDGDGRELRGIGRGAGAQPGVQCLLSLCSEPTDSGVVAEVSEGGKDSLDTWHSGCLWYCGLNVCMLMN